MAIRPASPVRFPSRARETVSEAVFREGSRPRRKRITPDQLSVLSSLFELTRMPPFDIREATARRLGMTAREVQVWFQNRRAKTMRERQNCDAALTRIMTYPRTSVDPAGRLAPSALSDSTDRIFSGAAEAHRSHGNATYSGETPSQTSGAGASYPHSSHTIYPYGVPTHTLTLPCKGMPQDDGSRILAARTCAAEVKSDVLNCRPMRPRISTTELERKIQAGTTVRSSKSAGDQWQSSWREKLEPSYQPYSDQNAKRWRRGRDGSLSDASTDLSRRTSHVSTLSPAEYHLKTPADDPYRDPRKRAPWQALDLKSTIPEQITVSDVEVVPQALSWGESLPSLNPSRFPLVPQTEHLPTADRSSIFSGGKLPPLPLGEPLSAGSFPTPLSNQNPKTEGLTRFDHRLTLAPLRHCLSSERQDRGVRTTRVGLTLQKSHLAC